MTDFLLVLIVILLVLAIVAVAVFGYLQLRKPLLPANTSDTAPLLQSLQTQLAVLAEKMDHVERGQQDVNQGVSSSVGTLREDLVRAREGVTALQAQVQARQELEQRSAESIRRLENIIAGTHTKGIAGENILEFVLGKLPAEWQVRDFTVGNRRVEFALRLPNQRILPIDSKWPGTALLDQWSVCTDIAEQLRLKTQIVSAVRLKAQEVKKYLDPSLTVNFGIAAVPDAVYDLCGELHTVAFQHNVVLISYSMVLPYLLLVFHTTLKLDQNLDLERLDAYLRATQQSITALQEEVEGRLSRAITMSSNARDDMRKHLSSISSSFAALQTSAELARPREGILVESLA
jgi:DNA recombination protein RmuC